MGPCLQVFYPLDQGVESCGHVTVREKIDLLLGKIDGSLDKRPQFDNRSAPAVDNGFAMDYRQAFAEMIAAGGEGYVDQEVRAGHGHGRTRASRR